MNISIINFGEPLPTDPSNPRWYRAGMLAKFLTARGHQVTWWASGFDHFTKTYRSREYCEFYHECGLKICLLPTPKYRKNISFKRFYNHVIAGFELKKRLNNRDLKPDLIFCAFPPVETSYEAVNFGLENNIPVIVDIRDRWPELITEQLPRFLRTTARLILKPYYNKVCRTFENSYALTGTTRKMLDFGLDMVGRKKENKDKVFLMTYEKPVFSENEILKAERFWDELRVNEDSLNICFFGTFVNQKAVDLNTCIKGYNLLDIEQKKRFKLIMCGDGPTLSKTKKLSSSESILFTGRINSAQIWTLMKRCKLGLLPYRPESHFLLSVPNKAAEYFAGELPIITSLTDGTLSEMLNANSIGIFYESGKPESFNSSLVYLSSNTIKLNQMKKNVSELYDREFDANTILSSVSDWLESISSDYPMC